MVTSLNSYRFLLDFLLLDRIFDFFFVVDKFEITAGVSTNGPKSIDWQKLFWLRKLAWDLAQIDTSAVLLSSSVLMLMLDSHTL